MNVKYIERFYNYISDDNFLGLFFNTIKEENNYLDENENKNEIDTSSILKTNVEDEIRKQIGNADIEYKINRNISGNRIDFVANGNICSINLQELSSKLLQIN